MAQTNRNEPRQKATSAPLCKMCDVREFGHVCAQYRARKGSPKPDPKQMKAALKQPGKRAVAALKQTVSKKGKP